jgi:hypothetical protein
MISLLQRVPIFAGLSKDAVLAFEDVGRQERVSVEAVMVQQDSPGHEMIMVVEGRNGLPWR